MNELETYVKTLFLIDKYTKTKTGVGVIDAYFGPDQFSKVEDPFDKSAESLIALLDSIKSFTDAIDDPLRKKAIDSDISSLITMLEWLSTGDYDYIKLVEQIFGITPVKFDDKIIEEKRLAVEEAAKFLGSGSLEDKIIKWENSNKIKGEELKRLIDSDISERNKKIGKMFQEKIFRLLPRYPPDNGVIYKTVTGEAWSGYNYYQGNYTSVNVLNLDMPFNKTRLLAVLYHEYEHHINNMFREMIYRENNQLELSVVLLHTMRSVISEGTADTARDFLGVTIETEEENLIAKLAELRSLVRLNSTYLLNIENEKPSDVIDYVVQYGIMPRENAEKGMAFISPRTPDGKINFWWPYVYTYYFGRHNFVLPTFEKAKKLDKLARFFEILYLNPHSKTAATWNDAFAEILND